MRKRTRRNRWGLARVRVLAPRGCARFTGESNKKAAKHSRDEALGRVCVCVSREKNYREIIKIYSQGKELWWRCSLCPVGRTRKQLLKLPPPPPFPPAAPAPPPLARHIKHQMRQMEDNVASVGNIYDIQGFSSWRLTNKSKTHTERERIREGKEKPKAAFSRLRNSWESLIFIARTKESWGKKGMKAAHAKYEHKSNGKC